MFYGYDWYSSNFAILLFCNFSDKKQLRFLLFCKLQLAKVLKAKHYSTEFP